MTSDEQAIRSLVALWHSATAAGDVGTVLGLMAEDVVFLVAAQSPMKGAAHSRSALSILHEQANGSWVLARDTNLLAPGS
jgi:ketosteroid isomerase-like protein